MNDSDYRTFLEASARAQKAYRWADAIEQLDLGLALEPLSLQTEFELRSDREFCLNRLAQFQAAAEEAGRLVELGDQLQDEEKAIDGLVRKSLAASYASLHDFPAEIAGEALKRARAHGSAALEARAHYAQAVHEIYSGNYSRAVELLSQALDTFEAAGRQYDTAWCLYFLAYTTVWTGQDGLPTAKRLHALAQKLGDPLLEARSYHALANASFKEVHMRREYLEKSLESYRRIGEVSGIEAILHNLGVFYNDSGLSRRGHALFKEALKAWGEVGSSPQRLLTQQLYVMSGYFSGEDMGRMLRINKDTLEAAAQAGAKHIEGLASLVRGMILADMGRTEQAGTFLEQGLDLLQISLAHQPVAMAFYGRHLRRLGRHTEALEYTRSAVALTHEIDGSPTLPPVHWIHYETIQADEAIAAERAAEAWETLDRAVRYMVTYGDNLRDPGLRRHYMIRGLLSSEIICEYARRAQERGESLDLLRPTDPDSETLRDPFRRLVDFGARLTSHRSLDDLPTFIMDEFIELSGAERALIALDSPDESGVEIVHSEGFEQGEIRTALETASDLLEQALYARQPQLAHRLGQAAEGEPAVLHQRSAIALPLVHAGETLGYIYADLREVFGPFTKADSDLLSVLAGQAAAAFENARWSESLERKVDERTEELSILNAVGEAMSRTLDVQTVTRIVGDKIVEIFQPDAATILLLDPETKLIHDVYGIEDGVYNTVMGTMPLGTGVTSRVIETRKPIKLDSVEEAMSFGAIQTFQPGLEERETQSYIGVPIMSGDRVLGVVDVQKYEANAFDRSHVSLLETLSANMGVAIENARLFEAEQRRAAELQIVNSVQAALAAKLDLAEIYTLVGDRIRDVFDAQVVVINRLDLENRVFHYEYAFEKGERFQIEPRPFTAIVDRMIEEKQTLLFNEGVAEVMAAAGATVAAGEMPQSILGVPLFSGSEVTGIISLQNVDREHAFSAGDVQLLETLAASLSVALENARLFDETQRLLLETEERNSELAVINSVQEGLVSRLDIQSIYDLVGDKIQEIFDAQIVIISSYDYAQSMRYNRYYFELGAEDNLPPAPLSDLDLYFIENKQPLHLGDRLVERFTEIVGRAPNVPAGEMPRSAFSVPMLLGDSVLGLISLQNLDREHAFSESDRRLLQTLANSLTVAIENARLFAETRRRADEMAALTEIGRDISATLDLATVLGSITHHARSLLSASDSAVFLPSDVEMDTMRATVALGPIAEQVLAMTVRRGRGILGDLWERRTAEIINQAASDPRAVTISGTESTDDERMMVVPLAAGERVTGLMAVWRNGAAFLDEDLRFLEGLAQQAATSIENARLFEEVERQRLYSEALVENSPVAIVTTDLDGSIVAWNPAAERLFGYTAGEVIGRDLDQLIAAGEILEEAAGITREVTRELRINRVTRRSRKDGRLVDVELLALPVLLHGEAVGIIAIYHDISQLLQARKEAESANEAKSAFLATMSHEIRTPMNAIIGMSGLLMDTPLNADQREFAEVIRTSGDALLGIINDILDFSKIEAGRMDLEEAPFDLRELLESSLDLIRLPAAVKGLDLAYQMLDDVPPALVGDVTRLRQILINLLNNAVKFTETGEIVLEVRGAKSEVRSAVHAVRDTAPDPADTPGPSNLLHFSIRDTGIGIPPDRLNRLFQAFSQVDASTSRKYGGTGLGLAISRSLAELMGGDMWVESVEGEGSTFHFTINAVPAAELDARPRLVGEQPLLRGRRLLIVDDNATNQRILNLQTRSWGMLSRATDSPLEALEWLARGDPFDAAILDMHMPEIDGVELASRIRDLPGGAALPLILFSSLTGRELKLEESPFQEHLIKPLKQSQLFDALVNILGDSEAPAPTTPAAPEIDASTAERQPLRILLVEDNAVNQKVALRLLERMGYRADVAGNGLEALDAVRQLPYDVLLMDVQMPEMDGLEATRRIRKLDLAGLGDLTGHKRQPRIIAMTANATEEDRRMCLEAGMDDYVSKPVRIEELQDALLRSPRLPDSGDSSSAIQG